VPTLAISTAAVAAAAAIAIAPAASAAPSPFTATEVARAAAREAPVTDAPAARAPDVVVEQDRMAEPVEAPAHKAERSAEESSHGELQAELHRGADDSAHRINGLVAGISDDRLAVDHPGIVGGHVNHLGI